MKIGRILILCTLLLPGFLKGQNKIDQNDFNKDFNEVAEIFEQTIQDYLYNFAEIRFSPRLDSTKRVEAIQSRLFLLKNKVKKLRAETFKKLASEPDVNQEFLFGYFSMLFSMEFPGLDYKYFDACDKKVKAIRSQ